MAKNISTGIDIGTTSTRVVVCEFNPGNSSPKVLALVKKNSRGLKRGYINNLDEIAAVISEALKEAERLAQVKIKTVSLGLGGIGLEAKTADGSIAVSRADSEINENDLNRVINASETNLADKLNRSIIHRIPLNYKLDGKKVLGQPLGLKGSKLEVKTLFITISSQHFKDAITAVESTGVYLNEVMAGPLAASLVSTTKLQKTSGCILLNIGSHTTSAVVFEDNTPISLQIFPLGSADITNDIALGFKIPLEEAEKIKLDQDESESKKKLEEIIQARLSDIFESTESHLKKVGRSGLLPAGIILTGGGSKVENIEELAKSSFRLPAKKADEIISTTSRQQIKDSAWSVAYGLCLVKTNSETENSLGLKMAKNTTEQLWRWLKMLWP